MSPDESTTKTESGADAGNGDSPKTPEQIETEIEQTRDELGDTVEALAEKTDVKQQAKKKVEATKEQAEVKVADAKEQAEAAATNAKERVESDPQPYLIAAGVLGAVVVLYLIRRR